MLPLGHDLQIAEQVVVMVPVFVVHNQGLLIGSLRGTIVQQGERQEPVDLALQFPSFFCVRPTHNTVVINTCPKRADINDRRVLQCIPSDENCFEKAILIAKRRDKDKTHTATDVAHRPDLVVRQSLRK